MAHAYLFSGPEGIGKFEVAKAIAKSFYCEGAKKSLHDVCGECVQCRLIDSAAHPHVVILDPKHTLVSKKVPRSDHGRTGMAVSRPEGRDGLATESLAKKRKEIPIQDVRELKRVFSLAPQGNNWRIAIINNADKMSQEAANSFLKLLEEPGQQTLIILLSAYPEMLPQTVVSRTQVIKFFGGRAGFSQEDKELRQELALLVRQRDLPRAFKFFEKAVDNDELRKKTIFLLLATARNKLLATPQRESVMTIKEMLRIAEIMETTNVNSRLALDVLFLKLV